MMKSLFNTSSLFQQTIFITVPIWNSWRISLWMDLNMKSSLYPCVFQILGTGPVLQTHNCKAQYWTHIYPNTFSPRWLYSSYMPIRHNINTSWWFWGWEGDLLFVWAFWQVCSYTASQLWVVLTPVDHSSTKTIDQTITFCYCFGRLVYSHCKTSPWR